MEFTARSTRIVIVGGGYSGSCLAVQLVRQTRQPLAITIVESRPQVGPGLPYAKKDPDHRLNAPTFSHTIHPSDAWHFTRWCRDEGVFDDDPDAIQPDGTSFVRREQFGRYLSAMIRQHASWPATGRASLTFTTRRSTQSTAKPSGRSIWKEAAHWTRLCCSSLPAIRNFDCRRL